MPSTAPGLNDTARNEGDARRDGVRDSGRSGSRRSRLRSDGWIQRNGLAGAAEHPRTRSIARTVGMDRYGRDGPRRHPGAPDSGARLDHGVERASAGDFVAVAREPPPGARDRSGPAAVAVRAAAAYGVSMGHGVRAASRLAVRAGLAGDRADLRSGDQGNAIRDSGTAGRSLAGERGQTHAAVECPRIRTP